MCDEERPRWLSIEAGVLRGSVIGPSQATLLARSGAPEPEAGPRMILVEFEFGRWRAVFLHRPENLGNPGGAPFGDVQLRKKVRNDLDPRHRNARGRMDERE